MPHYAILGGTGATGSALVSQLLPDPANHLKIYARSRPRLLGAFPGLEAATNAEVFTGDVSDVRVMVECLRGTDAVFMVLGTNTSERGVRIAQDAAEGMIAALSELREEYSRGKGDQAPDAQGGDEGLRHRGGSSARSGHTPWVCPTIIFLASASLSPHLSSRMRGRALLYSAIYYVYEDLRLALILLRAQDWIPLVTVCPGGLTEGTSTGGAILSTEPISGGEGLTAYGDLARGMVDIAQDLGQGEGEGEQGKEEEVRAGGGREGSRAGTAGGRWVGKEVLVASKGVVKDGHPERLLMNVIKGLIAGWLPWVYAVLKWVGAV